MLGVVENAEVRLGYDSFGDDDVPVVERIEAAVIPC